MNSCQAFCSALSPLLLLSTNHCYQLAAFVRMPGSQVSALAAFAFPDICLGLERAWLSLDFGPVLLSFFFHFSQRLTG